MLTSMSSVYVQQLFGTQRKLRVADMYMNADEVTLATALNNTVAAFPAVTIGSYPDLRHRLVLHCFKKGLFRYWIRLAKLFWNKIRNTLLKVVIRIQRRDEVAI